MDICEKIAYIKGLTDGLDPDTTTKEGKILIAIIDLLQDITEEICDIEDACDDMSEQIDAAVRDMKRASAEMIYFLLEGAEMHAPQSEPQKPETGDAAGEKA